jgi:hypothetical protein
MLGGRSNSRGFSPEALPAPSLVELKAFLVELRVVPTAGTPTSLHLTGDIPHDAAVVRPRNHPRPAHWPAPEAKESEKPRRPIEQSRRKDGLRDVAAEPRSSKSHEIPQQPQEQRVRSPSTRHCLSLVTRTLPPSLAASKHAKPFGALTLINATSVAAHKILLMITDQTRARSNRYWFWLTGIIVLAGLVAGLWASRFVAPGDRRRSATRHPGNGNGGEGRRTFRSSLSAPAPCRPGIPSRCAVRSTAS